MVPYLQDSWVPAFAGTTVKSSFNYHSKVVESQVFRGNYSRGAQFLIPMATMHEQT